LAWLALEADLLALGGAVLLHVLLGALEDHLAVSLVFLLLAAATSARLALTSSRSSTRPKQK
jgi:hypothetical protein